MTTKLCAPVVGSVGFAYVMQFLECNNQPRNLANATLIEIRFRKPSGALFTVTATFDTDGTDGKIKYVTQTVNDFDEAGNWEASGYAESPTGSGPSQVVNFVVESAVPSA